jgi:hypothetical protein
MIKCPPQVATTAARLRSSLTFANVVSLVALFLALGGSAYALTIPNNSIGSRQIRAKAVGSSKISSGAVQSAQVKDHSLLAKDFARSQLPVGARGNAGATGATGGSGPIGATGPTGPRGNSFDTGLPSGKTLKGVYEVTGQAAPQGGFAAATSETYAAALPATPALHMIVPGATPTQICPGTFADPQAAQGHLCVYESPNHGNLIEDPSVFIDPENTAGGTLGFSVEIQANATGLFSSAGTWAVTAP